MLINLIQSKELREELLGCLIKTLEQEQECLDNISYKVLPYSLRIAGPYRALNGSSSSLPAAAQAVPTNLSA